MENERQQPDYASNPRVKRKAGMGLGEIATSGLFLPQPNALAPSFQHHLHGENTQGSLCHFRFPLLAHPTILSGPDAPTSVSSCSLLLCPLQSFPDYKSNPNSW